jgi:hypothetical protein
LKTDVNVVGILKTTKEQSRIWIRVRDPQIRIRMKTSQTGKNASAKAVFQLRKPLLSPRWIPEFSGYGSGKKFFVLFYFAKTG